MQRGQRRTDLYVEVRKSKVKATAQQMHFFVGGIQIDATY